MFHACFKESVQAFWRKFRQVMQYMENVVEAEIESSVRGLMRRAKLFRGAAGGQINDVCENIVMVLIEVHDRSQIK